MEEYKDELNPIQYKYIYEVCRRLAPYLDDFDQYIKINDRNTIIFRSLIDSLFELDEFLDLLKRNSIIDASNDNSIEVSKKASNIKISDDKELIEKTFISYKSLFGLDRGAFGHFEDSPYDVINNFPFWSRTEQIGPFLDKYFRNNVTSADISLGYFMNDLKNECSDKLFDYRKKENEKISEMRINPVLFNAICVAINPEYSSLDIRDYREFFERLLDGVIRSSEVVPLMERDNYQSLKPGVKTSYGTVDKFLTVKAIKHFYKYAYVSNISRMNLEDYLDYALKNHNYDASLVLEKLDIKASELQKIIDLKRNKENDKLELIVNNKTIEDQLKKKLGEALSIKVPKFDNSTSVHIYEYGDEELKAFAKLINEISFYATKNITCEEALTDCINGVIPRLSLFDKLNPKNASRKMESKLSDTKYNLSEIEKNLKTQIMVYEYLIKIYDYKLAFIESLEASINDSLKTSDEKGLVKIGLEKKKENVAIDKYNTLTMMAQIRTLAHNHINVLNMLYRTKETFITVIEGQTLINSSISQEKAALKNIRSIVDIYDSALSNDFVSAFNLIEKLKTNGLDQTSALQLETNITNIQNLVSPDIIDEKEEASKKPVSKKVIERRLV